MPDGKRLENKCPDSIDYDDALNRVAEQLYSSGVCFGHGTEDAFEEANWLIMSVCGLPPDHSDTSWTYRITATQWDVISELLERRIHTRKPLAYLLGEAWFCGLSFSVDDRVLVPRSYFSEWIPERFEPWIHPERIDSILDLCCGSGCIGIAAAFAFPEAQVLLSDLSPDSLQVAEKNIRRHGLGDRVVTHLGDGFDGIDRCFDLILCNPPYVSNDLMDTLPPEYLSEPGMGLEAGEDGLDFISPLLEKAREYLTPDGTLIVEVGSAGTTVQEQWTTLPFTWLCTSSEEPVLFLLKAEDLVRGQ